MFCHFSIVFDELHTFITLSTKKDVKYSPFKFELAGFSLPFGGKIFIYFIIKILTGSGDLHLSDVFVEHCYLSISF